MAGHGCAKAALFGLCGVLLDQYGSVDEHGLHGKARAHRAVGLLFALGALTLAGLPPFGAGLGKALGEEAAGHALLPVFLLTSAVTGGALLRAAARIFWGAGRPPRTGPAGAETSGEGKEPEVREPRRSAHHPPTVVVPAVLLLLGLLVGAVPALAQSLGHGAELFTDQAGYPAAAGGGTAGGRTPGSGAVERAPLGWTAAGAGLGLASAALVCLPAGAALWWPSGAAPGRRASAVLVPLRRLHSGLVGDYLAWLVGDYLAWSAVGMAALLLAVALQA
ncbi:hypothetical protein [Streptomyces roseus]|uniref:hypothetical protein n=1 Tax=Streptomyces roseus TaxID=66430 RepID=UPI00131E9B64|nr:hypothetical protein [Streptomyces roseus]